MNKNDTQQQKQTPNIKMEEEEEICCFKNLVIENRRYWVFFCRSNFSNKVIRTESTTTGWLPVLPANPIFP
jgi:hypothetical protein